MQWSPLRGSSKQSFNFSKVTEDIAWMFQIEESSGDKECLWNGK